MNKVEAQIPKDTPAQYRERILRAMDSCLSVGLTGVHEAGISPEEIAIYKELIDDSQLDLRV